MKLAERRIYLEKLENLKDTPDIKVITGTRGAMRNLLAFSCRVY